jgi:hypothetical protein
VIISVFTLFWQLFVLFACCFGVGFALRSLIPREFSPLPKVLFSFLGGLFLVVLIPQNLFYLGVPVRISAWLIFGAALAPVWFYRRTFVARVRKFHANGDIRTLTVVALLIITFHGIVPIQQGLEWYYGKAYPDQLNYVLLAEFLKEEPYSTSAQKFSLRPWLAKPATVLKKERIGQSIITAEISVWSASDGKRGYAATIIFFLTVLGICLYASLRGTGLDRFMAGSGALLVALLPALTRLSLDGFLSQVSILFVFPFFASLLRAEEWSARSFTLFFSLTLAYIVAAYSEIAPIAFCTFVLGVMFVRRDMMRSKRLMLMSSILLIVLINPFYLRNLIEFLGEEYYIAANARFMDDIAPNILTLRGWSELLFGAIARAPIALFFDCCSLLLALLCLAGAVSLSRRDRLICGTILLPVLLVILYLATQTPPPAYPIAKLAITILPFALGLVLVGLTRIAAHDQHRLLRGLKKLISVSLVAVVAAGSARYYSEVLNNGGLLGIFREPRFLNVCRELEKMKNRRVFVFENIPLLTPWLCYHARHNDVYLDAQFTVDSDFLRLAPFSKVPGLKTVDFAVTPDRIIDLRNPSANGW